MKNINKNAVRALWLDGKSYLGHKAIDGFAMGQGEFTIETSFICNDLRDCLFYGQEQGFEFGIREKHLYFEMEGVGSITQNEEVSVDTDTLFSAAVSCKGGKLSLYFEGLPAADAVDIKPEASENAGNYIIGKGLNGYITDLRLRSCGMDDQEILLDNGKGLRECDSVEFWSDFTTVQYADKSKNALPLWAGQGIARCMNAASCTELSWNGGFVTLMKNNYSSDYTLLFKIYPKIENTKKMYVYSAVSGDGAAAFTVGIETDDKGDSYAFVENNGEIHYSEVILPFAAWIDFALRIAGTEASLYVDGAKQITFSFEGGLNNISAIIGIRPFQKKISYADSFGGYLDYFAEFECALDEEKINFYAEEQPYIFDESITTLYAFYCGEPVDLVSGGSVLLAGKSKAAFVKELNSMTAPAGMDLRVPQEVCAEWQELSEYEQWATTTAMDMVRETYSQSMGLIADEGILPVEQTATKQIRNQYAEEILKVKTVWPPDKESAEAFSFAQGALTKTVGGLGASVGGGALAGAGAAIGAGAAAGVGSVMNSKAARAVKIFVTVSRVLDTIIERLSEMESDSKEEMPEKKDGALHLVSVCCNHNGDPKTGSIHFHSDYTLREPTTMVYKNVQDYSIDMLLVTSELGAEGVLIECVIENTSKENISGIFGLKCQAFYAMIQQEVLVYAHNNVTVRLYIQLKNKEYDALAKYLKDSWQFFFDGIVLSHCTVNLYLLKNLPIAPWNTHVGEAYLQTCMEYPSLYFIKRLIIDSRGPVEEDLGIVLQDVPLAGNVKELFNNILNQLYQSRILVYDYQSCYTHQASFFKILNFLTALYIYNSVNVNCTDCANIVSLIAGILGIQMRMNFILGINGFKCNPIIPMAKEQWEEIKFSYHQVALYNEAQEFNKNAEIYDLSLKIDRGPSPSKAYTTGNTDKIGFLSGGYKAYQSDDIIVKINEPYYDKYYLERLIKQGEVASFTSKQAHTEFFTYTQPAVSNDLYTTLMQHYIQLYGLDDKKYADEIPQAEVQQLLQELGLESKSEGRAESVWSASDGREVTWFRNVEHLSAGRYLANVLMRYSCRLNEKEAPEIGERVFYGPDLLITYYDGNACAIRCSDMQKAEDTARRLRGSMN